MGWSQDLLCARQVPLSSLPTQDYLLILAVGSGPHWPVRMLITSQMCPQSDSSGEQWLQSLTVDRASPPGFQPQEAWEPPEGFAFQQVPQ